MQVKIVRFYLSEDSPFLNEVYDYLHNQQIKGATLFRGVKGFGQKGKTREASFLDFHFHLPMIIEFFDEPAKVDMILEHFKDQVGADRMVSWLAEMGIE